MIKRSLFVLFVLSIIFLSGCSLQKPSLAGGGPCGVVYNLSDFKSEEDCKFPESPMSYFKEVACLAALKNDPQICMNIKKEYLMNDDVMKRDKEYYIKKEKEGKLSDTAEFHIEWYLNSYYVQTVYSCFFSVAVANKDMETCEMIGSYLSDFCFPAYSFENEKITTCGNNTYCTDYCRFNIAEQSDDPDNCELIQDEEHKGMCYWHLAVSLGDISLCEKAWPMPSPCEKEYHDKYG